MKDLSLERRKFLVASGDQQLRDHVTEYLQSAFPGSSIVTAVDGADALFKLTNDAPDVIFIDAKIAKTAATRVVEWAISNLKDVNVGSVLIGPVPEQEIFVDQIVTGQVQFLPEPYDTEKLQAAVNRGLNFALSDQSAEFHLRFLNKEEILFREGEKAANVYILRKGKLSAFLKSEQGEVLLGRIEPGEFVGEMAYINGEPRNAHVRADELCELIEIPIQHLDHVLYVKPAWSRALMRTLSKRIKDANRHKLDVG